MALIQTTDFVDRFAIAIPFNGGAKLQQYIDYYENKYITELLGYELSQLFLEGYEDEEIYTKLYDPFGYDSDVLRKPVISQGVVHMLKCMIYAHYYRQDLGTATSLGKVKMQPEGGQMESDNYTNSFVFYNEGIKTYDAIQQYIKENKTDYEQFKGVRKTMSWFI